MSQHGNETWFTSSHNTNHNFDILAAKDIQQAFDRGTPTRVMRGIRVLPPALILNTKCAAWSTDDPMRTMEKKNDDKLDIQFLINYMASRGERTSREEVPNGGFPGRFCCAEPGNKERPEEYWADEPKCVRRDFGRECLTIEEAPSHPACRRAGRGVAKPQGVVHRYIS
jgi:hypothetical protein